MGSNLENFGAGGEERGKRNRLGRGRKRINGIFKLRELKGRL